MEMPVPGNAWVSSATGWRAWRDLVFDQFGGLEVVAPPQDPAEPARFQSAGSEAIRVCKIRGPAQVVRRKSEAACRATRDQIVLMRVDRGRARMRQDGRCLDLAASDVVLFSNARPYTLEMPEPMIHSLLLVRRSKWGPEVDALDRAGCTRVIEGASQRLLGGALRRLAAEAQQMRAAELDVLGLPILQLALASIDGAHGEPPSRDLVSRSLRERIRADIRVLLPDAELDPALIASRHGISLRYLHKLFADDGTTMMRFVRRERLAACLRDIHAAKGRPHLGAIAARWGFDDEGTFRRAFRAVYGHAPSAVPTRSAT